MNHIFNVKGKQGKMLNKISSRGQVFKQSSFVVLILAGIFLLSACGTQSASANVNPAAAPQVQSSAGNEAASSSVSFSKDVMPILQNSCNNCHGGQKTEKGLDMTTYSALMAGSQRGAVVIPGDAANSSFVHLVLNGNMPKRGQKLSAAQAQILQDWVNAGALNN